VTLDAAETKQSSGRPSALWMLGGATLFYAVLATVVAPHRYPTTLLSYALEVSRALPLILIPAILVLSLFKEAKTPLAYTLRLVRERGWSALAVAAGFCIAVSAFTSLKLSIPDLVPFYADEYFEWLDRVIHGAPPWTYTHAVIPDWAEFPLAYVYSGIWYILWFGVIGFVAFWRDERRVRYLWAHGLMLFILGTVLATAMSSYGPIFFDYFDGGPAYDELIRVLDSGVVGGAERDIAAYLYSGYGDAASTLGTGISAMPSMHVAIVVLNACFFWSLDRRLGIAGWFLVALILIGSVHFGWHYAIDGYLSLILVPAIWWVTGRLFASGDPNAAPDPT